MTDTSKIIQDTDTDLQYQDEKLTQESLSGRKCNGIMGVPITFMDKYNPMEFEILGCADYTGKYGSDELGIRRIGEEWLSKYRENGGKGHYTANMNSLVFYSAKGEAKPTFKRILIRAKKGDNA